MSSTTPVVAVSETDLQLVRAQLQEGEQLRYAAKQDYKLVFRLNRGAMAVPAVGMCMGAGAAISSASKLLTGTSTGTGGGSWFLLALGTAFVAAALFFLWIAWKIVRTARDGICVVTNERVLLIEPGKDSPLVCEWLPEDMSDPWIRKTPDGRGGIEFVEQRPAPGVDPGTPGWGSSSTSFYGMPQPDACERAMADLVERATSSASDSA